MTTIPIPTPVPMHLGALHPVEQWLTLLLAFGPFVVLGLVVWLRSREHAGADQAARPTKDRDRPPVS